MDENTKSCLDYIKLFAGITNFKGNFVISKENQTIVGIDIRFHPPLDLSNFSSFRHVMELLGK